MATFNKFNSFSEALAEKVHNLGSDQLTVALTNSAPLATNTVLANITEFGQTPLYTLDELRSVGVALALYPLSAFRAMNQAALDVYRTIRRDGTQQAALDRMQTRDELYAHLDYLSYEARLDRLFAKEKPK